MHVYAHGLKHMLGTCTCMHMGYVHMPDTCMALSCPCRYGVWADWQSPYVTLQPNYEAAQLGVFGRMFLNGHIYR